MGKFDGFFDDVVVNAKAAASAVSKKASAVCDSSKQKISAAEVRSDINSKLRDLGALTYKVQTQGVDLSEQISSVVAEITDLKDNLNVINQNIAASRNQRKCPNCDANVPKNSRFCNFCGARLDSDGENENKDESETVYDENFTGEKVNTENTDAE